MTGYCDLRLRPIRRRIARYGCAQNVHDRDRLGGPKIESQSAAADGETRTDTDGPEMTPLIPTVTGNRAEGGFRPGGLRVFRRAVGDPQRRLTINGGFVTSGFIEFVASTSGANLKAIPDFVYISQCRLRTPWDVRAPRHRREAAHRSASLSGTSHKTAPRRPGAEMQEGSRR